MLKLEPYQNSYSKFEISLFLCLKFLFITISNVSVDKVINIMYVYNDLHNVLCEPIKLYNEQTHYIKFLAHIEHILDYFELDLFI